MQNVDLVPFFPLLKPTHQVVKVPGQGLEVFTVVIAEIAGSLNQTGKKIPHFVTLVAPSRKVKSACHHSQVRL